jgi:hypothetical protein
MPRWGAAVLTLTLTAGALWPTLAYAVVQGKASANSATVRLLGAHYCSGVAIARHLVATAAHCGRLHVHAGGRAIAAATITRRAQLDDGRTVSVSGDAVILRLARPLPGSVAIAPVGDGDGEHFTIAGYGTTHEGPGGYGRLHEVTLVAAGPRALVDPGRVRSISASASFGDSGGPVLRGAELVGVITRAAHPSPRVACGHLTRWAPVVVSGSLAAAEMADHPTLDRPPAVKRSRRVARHRPQVTAGETAFYERFGRLPQSIAPAGARGKRSRHAAR